MSNLDEDGISGNQSSKHHHHHHTSQNDFVPPNDTFRPMSGPQGLDQFTYCAMDERLASYNNEVMEAIKSVVTNINNSRRSSGGQEMAMPVYTPLNSVAEGAGIYWIEEKGTKIGVVTIPQYVRDIVPAPIIPRKNIQTNLVQKVKDLLGNSTQIINKFFFTDLDMEDKTVRRSTNLANYIVKELDYFQNKHVHFNAMWLKQMSQLRLNTNTEQALAQFKQNSPSALTPPCDFGFTLEYSSSNPNNESGWKLAASVLMYFTVEGPFTWENRSAFRPVIRISGVHMCVESPGLLCILLAKICEQMFRSERWKDIFFRKGKDALKIHTLFRDPKDNTRFVSIGADDKSIREAIATAFIPELKVVLEYVNGWYNPFSYQLLFGKKANVLSDALSTFFDRPVSNYPTQNAVMVSQIGRIEPWGEIVGTIGDEGAAIKDSRSFTYMGETSHRGRLPDQDMDLLTKYPRALQQISNEEQYLNMQMEIISRNVPSFRPITYAELIDIDVGQAMGPILSLMQATDLYIASSDVGNTVYLTPPQDLSLGGAVKFGEAVRSGVWNVNSYGTQRGSNFGRDW